VPIAAIIELHVEIAPFPHDGRVVRVSVDDEEGAPIQGERNIPIRPLGQSTTLQIARVRRADYG
jgi:hypothetical protein